jgi:RimJ/RimL family protein N-acetyltransferase
MHLNSSSEDWLTLRPADLGDAGFLLALRNDPETRSFSFTQHEISDDEHLAWLELRLADADSLIWIALEGELPIGQLRLTRLDDSTAEVDVAVAAACRGRGVGRAIIARGAGLCEASWPGVVRLRARVMSGNTASLRAFSAAGYADAQAGDDSRAILLQRELQGGRGEDRRITS